MTSNITIIIPAIDSRVACSSRPLFDKIWHPREINSPIPVIFKISEMSIISPEFYTKNIIVVAPTNKDIARKIFILFGNSFEIFLYASSKYEI